MSGPVTQERLKEWLDYERPGDLQKWLEKNGIKYWLGKAGRICTTEEAINESLLSGQHRTNLARGQFTK